MKDMASNKRRDRKRPPLTHQLLPNAQTHLHRPTLCHIHISLRLRTNETCPIRCEIGLALPSTPLHCQWKLVRIVDSMVTK